MEDLVRAAEVARVGGERTTLLLTLLRELDADALRQPSSLPDWSRLSVVCHLRYGCHVLLRMTKDAMAGKPTSYYPDGRSVQRPGTLQPTPGEGPYDVLDDWASVAAELDSTWSTVAPEDWAVEVVEPSDNPDLGTVPLARLALARLTEVDVHATDLGIAAPDWSRTLVEVALPTRLRWLAARRSNHRAFDQQVSGSWLLDPTGGRSWWISVDGDRVDSRPATDADTPRATIRGTDRDLLALLLGRATLSPLEFTGDVMFAESFARAFPGP